MAKSKGGSSQSLDHTKLSPKVLGCKCEHEFQDRMYGKYRRLHNPGKDKYKCTVCSNVKS